MLDKPKCQKEKMTSKEGNGETKAKLERRAKKEHKKGKRGKQRTQIGDEKTKENGRNEGK
jgi:hypothetical protein